MPRKIDLKDTYWALYETLRRSYAYRLFCQWRQDSLEKPDTEMPDILFSSLYDLFEIENKFAVAKRSRRNLIPRIPMRMARKNHLKARLRESRAMPFIGEEPPFFYWYQHIGDVFTAGFEEIWERIKDNPPKLDIYHDRRGRKPRKPEREAFESMFRLVDNCILAEGNPETLAKLEGFCLETKWRTGADDDPHSTLGRDHREVIAKFKRILANVEHLGVFPGDYQQPEASTVFRAAILRGTISHDSIKKILSGPPPLEPPEGPEHKIWEKKYRRYRVFENVVSQLISEGKIPANLLR